MMLGTMRNAGTMYRANEPTLAPDNRDLAEALRGAIAFLPEGVMRSEATVSRPGAAESVAPAVQILAPDHIKENAFTTLEDGRIAIRTAGTLTPVARLSEEVGPSHPGVDSHPGRRARDVAYATRRGRRERHPAGTPTTQ